MLLPTLTVIAALAAGPAPAASEQPLTLHEVEQNVILRVNGERQRHGLSPLKVDATLVKSARRHAAWMTNSQQLQHTHQAVAENIAMGQSSSREAVQDWMNSPGHRANILGPYRRVGAAAYRTPRGVVYWCLQLLH